MNDQQMSQEQRETIEQFNASVDSAILANFRMNKELMETVSPAAVVLANGLSAADLTAAIASARPNASYAMIDEMLDRLLEDMKKRAHEAFDEFARRAAALRAANQCNAEVEAV